MKIDNLHKYTELQPNKAGDINYLYWLLIIIFIAIIYGSPILELIPDERAKSATTLAVFSITLLLLIHKHNEDYKKDMVNLSSVLFKNYIEHRKIYLEKLDRFKHNPGIDLEKLYFKLFPKVQTGDYNTNISPLLSKLDAHTKNLNIISEISSTLKEFDTTKGDIIFNISALKGINLLQLELSMESLLSTTVSIKKIIGITKSSKINPECICLEVFRSAHSIYAENNSDLDSLEKSLGEVARARKALEEIHTMINFIVGAEYSGHPLSINLDDTEKTFNNLEYHKITPLIDTLLEELNSRMDDASDAIRYGEVPSRLA